MLSRMAVIASARMNNRLEALRVLVVAAESRNFREAATRLAVSPQVVTRVVRELEDELGEPLFHRSTRGVQLTDFGTGFAPQARAAVQGVDALFQRRARRAASELAGTVRIAAPSAIGRARVMEALAAPLAAHPGLRLDLRLSEAIADAVDQQIDVGVRIGPQLRDSRFVARAVARIGFELVASPALLQRVGMPDSQEALWSRPVTALIDRNTGRPWPWLFRGGRQVAPPAPTFVADDPEAECAAVVAGLGIGQLARFLAAPHLAAGRLVRLLPGLAPEPFTLWVYRAQRSPVPARVRLVYDTLARALADLA